MPDDRYRVYRLGGEMREQICVPDMDRAEAERLASAERARTPWSLVKVVAVGSAREQQLRRENAAHAQFHT